MLRSKWNDRGSGIVYSSCGNFCLNFNIRYYCPGFFNANFFITFQRANKQADSIFSYFFLKFFIWRVVFRGWSEICLVLHTGTSCPAGPAHHYQLSGRPVPPVLHLLSCTPAPPLLNTCTFSPEHRYRYLLS